MIYHWLLTLDQIIQLTISSVIFSFFCWFLLTPLVIFHFIWTSTHPSYLSLYSIHVLIYAAVHALSLPDHEQAFPPHAASQRFLLVSEASLDWSGSSDPACVWYVCFHHPWGEYVVWLHNHIGSYQLLNKIQCHQSIFLEVVMELESAGLWSVQVSAVSSKSNQSYMSQQFAKLKSVKSIYIYKR